MKLSKAFFLGLGTCAFISTSVSAKEVLCPAFGDIQCPADEHTPTQHFCTSSAPWNVGTFLVQPSGQYINPVFTSVKANQDTQTCDYTYQGGLVLQLKKQPSACTAIETPKPGFNCP